MRLLDRTLILLVLTAFLLAGTSSVIQFQLVKSKIEKRVDKKLLREKFLIKEQLKDIEIEDGFSYNTPRASVKFISKINNIERDSLFYREDIDENNEKVNYRVLKTLISIKDQSFKVEIRKEVEETATFVQSIYQTFLITLLSVTLIFIVLKYFLLRNTWLPFFETLEQLKTSDFQHNLIHFDNKISVKEFQDLNIELNDLALKVYDEFQSQKRFTENVNHELMTPLAIIRSKLELIIQSENLNESDLKLVSDIFITIDRLTKLNKSLILLSKIENHQFEEKLSVSLPELIDELLNSFEDQIRAQGIKIRKKYLFEKKLFVNEMLAYILFSNLLKNAIFHNLEEHGFININLTENNIEISNSGLNNNIETNIFDRFVKQSASEDSIGLGLSIIRKICELSNLHVKYSQEENKHTFTLTFRS